MHVISNVKVHKMSHQGILKDALNNLHADWKVEYYFLYKSPYLFQQNNLDNKELRLYCISKTMYG